MDETLLHNAIAFALSNHTAQRKLGLGMLDTFIASGDWDKDTLLDAILDYFNRDTIRCLLMEGGLSLPLAPKQLLKDLGKIESLHWSGGALIPKGLDLLKHQIKKLYVSNGCTEDFLSYLGGFSQLEILEMKGCGIGALDDQQWLWFPALVHLDLTANQLVAFPPQISSMLRLQTLILTSNNLTTIAPETLQLPSSLTLLNLTNNQLATFPPQICTAIGLKVLILSNNPFTDLPPQIAQLQQLESLYLEGVPLQSVPTEISQLPQLQRIYMPNTPVSAVPQAVLAMPQLRYILLSGKGLTLRDRVRWGLRYAHLQFTNV